MLLTDLTKRFIEKCKTENTNLRKLASELNIPYDRLYKWSTGKSNPKPPDDAKIEAWLTVEENSILSEEEKELRDLIKAIQIKKGWTQGQVSLGAGWDEYTLTQTLSRKTPIPSAIKQLKLVYKDVLEDHPATPQHEPLTMQAIVNLTRSNMIMAEAQKEFAMSNKTLVATNQELVEMVKTERASVQNLAAGAAMPLEVLGFVAEIASGTKYQSKQEALVAIHRMLHPPLDKVNTRKHLGKSSK